MKDDLPPTPVINANADNAAVARNAIAGYAAWLVNLVIGLVLTPILLRRLGADHFGAWTLALAVSGYVAMIDLGLGVATARLIASSLASGDRAAASRIAGSARAAYLCVATIGLGALGAFAALIPMLTSGAIATGRVRAAIVILGAGLLIALALNVYPAISIGAGRTDLGTTVGILSRLATAAGQVAAVLLWASIPLLAAVTAIGTAATALAIRAVARSRFGEVDTSLRHASWLDIRRLISSGWRNAAIAAAAAVALQSDVIVVGSFLSTAAVAAYGVAVRAATVVQDVATRATDVLIPTFAHATVVGDRQRTQSALYESVFLSRAILAPALVGLVAFGQPLLRLWLDGVPHGARSVLILLVLGLVVAAPGHSCFVLLTGMNRLSYLLIGATVTATLNLGLSVLLTWRVGITGPVLGSLGGFCVWDLVLLPRYVCRILDLSWPRLAASGIDRLMLPSIVSIGLAWLLVSGLGWRSPLQGLAGVALTSAVYTLALGFAMGRDRRSRYRRLIGGAFNLRRGAAEA